MTIAEKIQQVAENSEAIANNELRVYEAGQEKGYSQAEYDWWVKFTNNNTRKNYAYAFNNTTFEYFRPPFKIAPNFNQTFNQMFTTNPSLKKIESKYFDFSQRPLSTSTDVTYGYYYTFAECYNLEEVEDIGLKEELYYRSTFSGATKLHTIACIRAAPYTNFTNCFFACSSLENLTIEGTIGQNGFDIHWSTKLSKDSITSIIDALSPDTSGLTVTLSLTAVNTAFESGAGAGDGSNTPEWAALEASKSNWTISLV